MSLTKESLTGLEVYDAEGHLVGQISNIGFQVGQESISIVVTKGKTDMSIPWKNIQAIGEIVILKKPEGKQEPMKCPSCGEPLRWIEQYKRWYCEKEKKYA
jgi:sporulation protein YlmC with PRC-barrel domain